MDWVYVAQNKDRCHTLAIMIKKSGTHKILEIAWIPEQLLGFEVNYFKQSV